MAKKYASKLTKDEMMTIIVEHFEQINDEYDLSLNNDENIPLRERKFGKYIAMIELLQKLKIYKNIP